MRARSICEFNPHRSRNIYMDYVSTVVEKDKVSLLHANNKGTDQPVHLCSLVSTYVLNSLDSIISKLASYKVSIF